MITNKSNIDIDKVSNEMQLLLLTSLKSTSDEQKEIIKQVLKKEIDYKLFLKMVKKHRVHPLVYKNLKEIAGLDIDENVINTLEKKYKKSTIKLMKLTGELLKITSLLDENNIRYILLKGPVLGFEIYGDISYRTSRDLDILVDKDDIAKVENLLFLHGYENTENEVNLTEKQREFTKKTEQHFSYLKNDIYIELHWRYYSQCYKESLEDIWKKRKGTRIFGKTVNTLNEEENFLYLASHGSKHGWIRLRWLCDIVEIIKSNQLKWTSIINKAKEEEILHIIVQTLILVNKLFNVEIPKEAKTIVENNSLGNKLASMAMPLITGFEDDETSPGKTLYMYFKKYNFANLRGIKEKSRYFLKHFYPTTLDYKLVRFRDKYFFLYFLVRPYFKLQRIFKR